MSYAPSPPPARAGSRLSGLVLLALLLLVVALAPYLAENIEYSMTRGRLKAQADVAEARLGELAKKAELVKLADTSEAFRLVAKVVGPSVVHINTEQLVREEDSSGFDEFFGMPGRGEVHRAIGQGSGVIVDSAEGYIITNYHVIQGARRIEVRLSDSRVIDRVTVVGSDVLTDLAVLKISANDLRAAEFGDSEQLEVGDWVLAVGNPYGLDRTVTCGIVSAKKRRALSEDSVFQNFLQTDAAVNPGNSGGPLVDISGKVVGITTAIVGSSYQGISFAIPSDVVQHVYQQLKAGTGVARGYLGVGLQDLTPELAKQLQLGQTEGVIVTGVQPGSPADKAGVEQGDVIVSWNGEAVHDRTELRLLAAGAKVGSTVKLKVMRDGQIRTLDVAIAQRKDGK